MENHHHHHHHHQQLMRSEVEASLPPGFRFHPTDEELISYYLLKKVLDSTFTTAAITQLDLIKCDPWNLPAGKGKMGEREWYLFSQRDRKYPTGMRANRATEGGYWKATGKDREIYSSKTGSLVGMKKTLVFYRGRAPKGHKTNWVMHQYRLHGKLASHYLSPNSQDEWVISRVFQKTAPGSSGGGAAKKRPSAAVDSSIISEVMITSSSSVSLPPLLEPSPVDVGVSAKEHVPCFSTTEAPSFSENSLFELPPPPPSSSLSAVVHGGSPASLLHSVGVSAFPSLRSLQENLHLPNFFPAVAPPPMHGGAADQMPGYSAVGQWLALDNEKMCGSELNCIWG